MSLMNPKEIVYNTILNSTTLHSRSVSLMKIELGPIGSALFDVYLIHTNKQTPRQAKDMYKL